jgi:hypothetical protein
MPTKIAPQQTQFLRSQSLSTNKYENTSPRMLLNLSTYQALKDKACSPNANETSPTLVTPTEAKNLFHDSNIKIKFLDSIEGCGTFSGTQTTDDANTFFLAYSPNNSSDACQIRRCTLPETHSGWELSDADSNNALICSLSGYLVVLLASASFAVYKQLSTHSPSDRPTSDAVNLKNIEATLEDGQRI